MGDSHRMLQEQTYQLQETRQVNKDIESGYDRSNKVLNRIKWQNIAIKALLFLIIVLLGIVDVSVLIMKMTK